MARGRYQGLVNRWSAVCSATLGEGVLQFLNPVIAPFNAFTIPPDLNSCPFQAKCDLRCNLTIAAGVTKEDGTHAQMVH